MKTPNVKCESCGIDFYKRTCEIKRRKRHFCSVTCSKNRPENRAKNSTEVNCKNCNKLFLKPNYNLKKSENHFCSRQCHSESITTKIQVICAQCHCSFFIRKHIYKKEIKNYCCSKLCSGKFRTKKVEVVCLICEKKFLKPYDRIAKRPRHCCSPECAIILVKSRKNWGSRRSKLELYVEEKLVKDFNFKFLFNETNIGYELDIHIPEINYAIEINGITHYEPIYGNKIFQKKQEIDRKKLEKCKAYNIDLAVVNVSRDRNYPNILEKRYLEIKNLIINKMKSLNFNVENLRTQECQ